MSYALPDRTSYRFTADDETTIRVRLTQTVDQWNSTTGPRQSSDVGVLIRIGAHAIGCTTDDLRDAEIAWITDQAVTALAR